MAVQTCPKCSGTGKNPSQDKTIRLPDGRTLVYRVQDVCWLCAGAGQIFVVSISP